MGTGVARARTGLHLGACIRRAASHSQALLSPAALHWLLPWCQGCAAVHSGGGFHLTPVSTPSRSPQIAADYWHQTLREVKAPDGSTTAGMLTEHSSERALNEAFVLESGCKYQCAEQRMPAQHQGWQLQGAFTGETDGGRRGKERVLQGPGLLARCFSALSTVPLFPRFPLALS